METKTPAPAPPKPSDAELWIAEHWPITDLTVYYNQTGDDTAETVVDIIGRNEMNTCKWSSLRGSVEVGIDYNSCLRLNYSAALRVKAWKTFIQENAADLAALAHLKTKLGLE